MTEENIETLKKLLKGRIPKDKFAITQKRLLDTDDEKLPKLTATIKSEFRSGWINLFLNWLGYLGPIYMGKISKTIKFWLLSFLASAMVIIGFIAPTLLNSFGLDSDTTDIIRIVIIVASVALSLILSIWWIFDLFYSFSDARKYNYQKFTEAISK